MRRDQFLRAGAAALFGGVSGTILPGPSLGASASGMAIPNLPVVDQTGRQWRFYADLVRGRAVVVNFFFTACGDTCPLVTQSLREVQDLLGERMGRDIFMLSVSLQPELETPAVLRDYAELWDARPGWSFLTGAPTDIEELRRAMGFADSDPAFAADRDSHTGLVRYGNDRLQRWAGTAGTGRPAWIARAVTSLADMG